MLSSPSSPSSLHIPSIPNSTFTSLQNLRVPPLYTPPTPPSPSSSPNPDLSPSPSPLLSESSHYLPLLSLNPLGPMTYAWRIADTALALSEKHRGLRKGMMNEPVGAGVRFLYP